MALLLRNASTAVPRAASAASGSSSAPAKALTKFRRVGAGGEPVPHVAGVAGVHLVRVEQRLRDEGRERVGSPVPEEAADAVGEVDVFFPVEVKARHEAEVEDGGRISSREVAGPAASRHAQRRPVVARESARGIVATRAARPRRVGERTVEEDFSTQAGARIGGGGESRRASRSLRGRRGPVGAPGQTFSPRPLRWRQAPATTRQTAPRRRRAWRMPRAHRRWRFASASARARPGAS